MKKIFLFAAAVAAAMTINAQEAKVVVISELANYIDFEALCKSDEAMTKPKIDSENAYTLANGTELKGFKNSENAEATVEWNIKEGYDTTIPTPAWEGVDSLTVGSMFRAASGVTITLGAFKTSADGKLAVYYQPNGDSERGVSISVMGGEPKEFVGDGKKLGKMRPGYVAEIDLAAGSYDAGDVVIKLIVNKSNIFGVRIEKLAKEGVENVQADVKAVKVFENGQLVIIKNGVRYNALGAQL